LGTQITGFDIGDKTLKMAYFNKGKLLKAVCVDVPEGMVADGQIISAEGMSTFIAQTAKQNGIPKKDAALLLPSAIVATRTIIVPIMTENQLKLNIPFEFQDYLTEEKSKYVFDYEVLSVVNGEDGKPKELEIFACAIQKEALERYSVILQRAGYNLKLAVPEEYIFSRLCRGDMGITTLKDGACAILDFGERETRMHIMLNGQYDTKRTFDLAVQDIENIVADMTLTDVHMAHSYVVSNYENILNSDRLMDFYNSLAVEILKSANFYNYNNGEYELKDIYLIGGGSSIDPLVKTIKQVTGLTLHPAWELLGDKYICKEPWHMLRAICCGSEK